ncbi:hypothetical protein [Fodinibius sediminis]|uniref:Uncharacterized protein n=1 Tax=Fodinibius sediminis TaxID=1214077 RepID=A0A521FF10_9BACT|nr:hypothetical protein [Fodinibius sediminis]SMO94798.1 hypothetical protein SAMN06265218_1334 [Fodinibius sediminis]
MDDSDVLKLVKILEKTGLSVQSSSDLNIKTILKSGENNDLIESLKKYEAPNETSLSNDELFEIYQTISKLHKSDSNNYQDLLYQIRSIKYKPTDQTVRINYLSDFLEFTIQKRDEFTREEIDSLLKEFFRFNNFIEMKWGRDNEVFKLSQQILEELEANDPSNRDRKNEELSKFIERFRDVNRRYRPDEQALDYASQIIYEQYNTYELDS